MTVVNRQVNENKVYAEKRALYLYEQACKKNFLRQFVSILKQENNDLLDMQSMLAVEVSQKRVESVRQIVSLTKIKGSANNGRTHDFDGQFRPKNKRTQSRWVGLAAARSLGKRIPPVQLTKISGIPALEDVYFVEDGHHRISLATVMGEDTIDAEVTIMHVTGGHA